MLGDVKDDFTKLVKALPIDWEFFKGNAFFTSKNMKIFYRGTWKVNNI